jgi:hypothetical protein
MVCTEHRDTALGEQTERELAMMTRRLGAMARLEGEEEKRQAYTLFRRQLMRGDYAAVFSSKMTSLLDQAGEDIDLKLAIGSLRVGIMRVLTEEEHPSRMAHALAKLTFAMGRAMTLQAKWMEEGREDGQLSALLNEILADLDSEEREKQRLVDEGIATVEMIAQMKNAGIRVGTWEANAWIERYHREVLGEEGPFPRFTPAVEDGLRQMGRGVDQQNEEELQFKPLVWPPPVYAEYEGEE